MTPPLAELAWLAELVYEPWDLVGATLEGRLLRTFDSSAAGGHTQAMLARARDGSPVLAFRGTQVAGGLEWLDLLANLGLPARWAGPGRARRGYAAALDRLFAPIVAQLDGPVTVTGHSMGGALATLFAVRAGFATWQRVARVVTFGAPRPARASAYAGFTVPLTRVVNAYDFAPDHGWPLFRHPPGERLDVDSGGPRDRLFRHGIREYRRALAAREG